MVKNFAQAFLLLQTESTNKVLLKIGYITNFIKKKNLAVILSYFGLISAFALCDH